MKKENLINSLNRHNIDFKEKENEILLINKPFEIIVKFHENEFLIDSELVGWNWVTDFMRMKFNNAKKYLSLFLLFQGVLVLVITNETFLINSNYYFLLIPFLIIAFVKLLFYKKYSTELVSLKQKIKNWTES